MTTPPGAEQQSEADVQNALRAQANSQLAIGALLLVVGVIITAVTYGNATNSGGTYIIAYGPIVVGVIKIVRGLMYLNREPH